MTSLKSSMSRSLVISLDKFVSVNTEIIRKQQISRHSAMAPSKRPMTSVASGMIATMNRPNSTISLKRPVSGHSQIQPNKFFTRYNKEAINIGDDIPFEELFDRNERTLCATFAKFGDLSYHTPNYRIGHYMQFSAKLKVRHMVDIIGLQNTVTCIEKNEFEIPIQLGVVDDSNPLKVRGNTGISSVFKKEEVEREPITVSLFPEYFEDNDGELPEEERDTNREAIKYQERQLQRMGGNFDPERVGSDEYVFYLPSDLPQEILDLLKLSYRRFYHYLNEKSFIGKDEISSFKREWITNAISRVPERYARLETSVRSLFQEIFEDYRMAVKHSILNYILLSKEERKRLSIHLLLRESPSSAERIWRAGAYSSLLYPKWHEYVENSKTFLQNNLYNMNIVNSSLMSWNEDFVDISLVERDIIKQMAVLGKSLSPITFVKIQRQHRDKIKAFMQHVWLKGAMLIMKKFKFIRVHREKRGFWNLLGFSLNKIDFKGFLRTSIESISVNSKDSSEDTTEAVYNIISSKINNTILNVGLVDIPLSEWGSKTIDDLLDIRDCPSYQYYSLYNREPIILEKNGYKLLSTDVRAKLRSSVSVLLAIKLREKVEKSIAELEDMILRLPLFSKMMGDRMKRHATLQNLEDSSSIDQPTIQNIPSTSNIPAIISDAQKSKKGTQVLAEPTRPILERDGKEIGPKLDFNEIKFSVEPVNIFFLTFRFSNPDFLKYQSNFQPFLQLEMMIENEIIRFTDSEDNIRKLFMTMHSEVVSLFKDFLHPEYVSIGVKDDPLEVHPTESFPTDYNSEAFYRRFMPHIEMREKKRKRKVQSILESAQIEEVDEKAKTINVNKADEIHYVQSCQKVVERIIQHYNEAKVSFGLFDQFKLIFDKTIEKYAKQFMSKNHISLEDFRKNVLIIRAYKSLLEEVPDQVYFPLFEVKTEKVKDFLKRALDELESMVSKRVQDYIVSEYNRIKADFGRLKDIMSKNIETATQWQETDQFMTGLTQDKIQLRNRSFDIYKKMLFCSRLFIVDEEMLSKAREVFECPSQLEVSIINAAIKHQDQKLIIIKSLEEKTQTFLSMIKKIGEDLVTLQGVTTFEQYIANTETVKTLDKNLSQIEDDRKDIIDQESKLFGKSADYKDVIDLRKKLAPVQELWVSVSQFMNIKNDIYDRRVFEINILEVDDAISDAERAYKRLRDTFSKSKEELKVVEQLEKKTDALKMDYEKIAVVCNKGLADRHWDQIKQVLNNTGFNYKEDRLCDLLDMPEVTTELNSIAEISKQASTEYKLQQMLSKIEAEWKDKKFEVLSWKNTDILIFAGVAFEDLQMTIDESVLRIQTIRSDPGVKFIEENAAQWEEMLIFLQEACEIWVKVQQAYVYLVPVFNSEDIRTHMANEAGEFKKIQNLWEELMTQVAENLNVTSIKQIPNLLTKLKKSLTTMEHILKELDDYLDMKRTKFSRFYFLSNEEMLSILSETKDPQLVQPHLRKCFEGITELVFTIENDITGMKSEMGEVIDLEMKIVPKNYKSAVEEWLVKIEEQMKISLKAKIEECLLDLGNHKSSRISWIKKWPGQCVLLCSQLSWTMLVEDRLKLIKQMKDLKDELTVLLEEIVKMIRGDLSSIERMTLNALITLEVHSLDIVVDLIAQRCNTITDFDWVSQLRYYMSQTGDKNIFVEMVMTKIDYGFEYLGNSTRLVITPLTDRCYRTLMSALFLNLGGAPEGPAGTGKTETTKDLAKAVAIQCVVHNCTGSLNAKSMAKFFKGLISSGAWSCFDEFNRIQVEVLSVIAQQIHQIQTAKNLKLKEFKFDGTLLKIRDSCNIFITMNPGYAGRSELPDNLKSLFRPVAMMVPDYATIAEISLYSSGFVEARPLSKKIVAVLKLCSEQLSFQHHYDYGMRTVKTVLVTASLLSRRWHNLSEDEIIMMAIKEVSLPKFVSQDMYIFNDILKDLFPGIVLEDRENAKFNEALVNSVKSNKMIPHQNFKMKVLQLNEMIKTRHGLMLVGDGMSGKTSVFKALAQTLNSLSNDGENELKVNYYVINPKAITINQLYGYSDPISQEWSEGILSHTFKGCSKKNKTREWIVLDGPVDAEWIENMNTVLDDNKCLCLMSSDKIPMSKFQTMIFETENLAKASLATVSRCGMIYLNSDMVGIRNFFQSWLNINYDSLFEAEVKDHLLDLFDVVYKPAVKYMETGKKHYQHQSEMSLTSSFTAMFKVLLTEAGFVVGKHLEEEGNRLLPKLNILFVQAIAWSLGMSVMSSYRKEFDKLIRRLVSDSVKSEVKADRIVKFDKDIVPPEFTGATMYNYL
jgi:dynein heavy chain